MQLRLAQKFYLALLLPLAIASAAVVYTTDQALTKNSLNLSQALKFQGKANLILTLILKQDDASKAILLDPDQFVSYSEQKISAYDSHLEVLKELKGDTSNREVSDLIDDLRRFDETQLRDRDTRILELVLDDPAAARKLYFTEYREKRDEYEKKVRKLNEIAQAEVAAAEGALLQANARAVRIVLLLLATVMVVIFFVVRALAGKVDRSLASLSSRNGEMKEILDNAQQGFLKVAPDGALSAETSAVVEEWFGSKPGGTKLWEFLCAEAPERVPGFEFAWGQVADDILPLDLALSQLPSQLLHKGRHFEIAYTPILGAGGKLQKVLTVLTDVSEQVKQKAMRRLSEQRAAMYTALFRDKGAFGEFVRESEGLLEALGRPASMESVRRMVHTLKGNCSLNGLGAFAELCHDWETKLASDAEAAVEPMRESLQSAWAEVASEAKPLLSGESEGGLDVRPEDLDELVKALRIPAPLAALLGIVESWRLAKVRPRLLRMAAQAQGIAAGLGRDELHCVVEAEPLRADLGKMGSFWSNLVHVIRNAVDHGIEPKEQRVSAGKAPRGSMRFSAKREAGGPLCVEVADDGRGIDWERIAEKARSAGLPSGSRQELEAALFVDGVSSRDVVTQLSGRGVGMGAVKQACEALGGWVEVDSSPGRGTTFRFLFPGL